jgi:hypothetical protein
MQPLLKVLKVTQPLPIELYAAEVVEREVEVEVEAVVVAEQKVAELVY